VHRQEWLADTAGGHSYSFGVVGGKLIDVLLALPFMTISLRYLLAVVVNVALPAVAYRIALPHLGLTGALLASMAPLLAWMCVDLVCFRHFDALSALAVATLALSLLISLSAPAEWLTVEREPLVSGAIGMLFLLSLPLRRPLVFYLARSTLSRERQGRELKFDAMWNERPDIVTATRFMTAVWGVGLVTENAARLWIAGRFDAVAAQPISSGIGYTAYIGLTIWTFLYRRYWIKKREPDSTSI
jgi:hypothetical protein